MPSAGHPVDGGAQVGPRMRREPVAAGCEISFDPRLNAQLGDCAKRIAGMLAGGSRPTRRWSCRSVEILHENVEGVQLHCHAPRLVAAIRR